MFNVTIIIFTVNIFLIFAFIEVILCHATKLDKEQQEYSDNSQLKFIKEIGEGYNGRR